MTTRLAAVTVLLLSTAASAQDAAQRLPDRGDTRWAVYTACTLVFVAITAYLIMSHKRLRVAAENLEHVERRVDGLAN